MLINSYSFDKISEKFFSSYENWDQVPCIMMWVSGKDTGK